MPTFPVTTRTGRYLIFFVSASPQSPGQMAPIADVNPFTTDASGGDGRAWHRLGARPDASRDPGLGNSVR
jgi:hypothetical protein